ncbi:MAG: glycosyltransferase [Rivularia sp. T60_A2020_040]|nr:glycosyltransferase [Rivularia sp. T60_A2020_040]
MLNGIDSSKPLKILHLITDLDMGGAEKMLYNLLSKTNRQRFKPIVLSLIDRGIWGDQISALDIPVHTLAMESSKPTLAAIWRLFHLVHQLQPDLIQGWMYHGNLAAQLTKISHLKSVPIIWNIRHSIYSLNYEKPSTAAIIKLLASLSNFSTKIIYNSNISASQHKDLGYKESKTQVIPNGFDTQIFMPSIKSRMEVRKELGLAENTFLIGRISRYHAMKDFANFLRAGAFLLKENPDVHFLLAGSEVSWENQNLTHIINELKIADHVHLLGERQDIPHLTAALDIASTSSYFGEAFPNVIGEAMSCGVPCAVTDVGDSAFIVGNTGKVLPPKDSQALANAWQELIDMGIEGRRSLGKAARERIINYFSLNFVVNKYEKLYESILTKQSNY